MPTATSRTDPSRLSKGASLVRVTVAYVVAVAAGAAWLVLGPDTGTVLLDALVADVIATLVIFGFSRAYRNSSFYDAYWSVIPPLIVAYWWVEAGRAGSDGVDTGRAALLALVVLVWAVRLTGNWVHSFPGLHHEDWRYPLLRERGGPGGRGAGAVLVDLFAIHLIPTLQVFAGLLPAYLALSTDRPLGWLDVLAAVVGLGAVTLETVADVQMHRFVRTRQPGQAMDRGLWAWSRHPNYLGEWLFWVSLALFGLAASPGDAWWLWVGSALMLAMFLGASIPMMEERSLARRPEYQRVVDSVSMFLPRRPRRVPS